MDGDFIQSVLAQLTSSTELYLPRLLGAVVILIIGWIIALIAGAVVRGILRRTGLDEKLAGWLFGERRASQMDLARSTGKAVFYLVMLFVLVAFFQALGLTMLIEPINNLLNQVFVFIPQLVGAGVLLLIAWIIATVLRRVVAKALEVAKVDQRLGGEEGEPVPVTGPVSEAVYWLILLLFLPAILGALSLGGLLDPVRGMMDKVLGFLPNLLTAGLLIIVGWFVSRLGQRIVTNLLAAVGTDQLSERVGLATALGAQKLSGILGVVVQTFILIPVAIAALDALALEALTEPTSAMLSQLLGALPNIFAAVLVVAIAYVIGRLVSGMVTNLLAGMGFDNLPPKLGLGQEGIEGLMLSAAVGYLAMVAIIFFAAMEAFALLGFAWVGELLSFFIVFAGHILMGLLILGIGLYLANLVALGLKKTGTAHATLLSMTARVAILVLTGAMALRQMGLANEIINMAFGLLLGALAVALALAFGLGGRDLAARQLQEWKDQAEKGEK